MANSNVADKTAGQWIAERYLFDDGEVETLAKDIDSAIANAIDIENEACAKVLKEYVVDEDWISSGDDSWREEERASSAIEKLIQQIRNRRKKT